MTNSFERLSRVEQIILIAILASLPLVSFPGKAEANVQNKTALIIEIKNFPSITIPDTASIPTVQNISDKLNNIDESSTETEESKIDETAPAVEATPIQVEKVEVAVVKKPVNQIPPRVAPENRVYMHEPEIRAYICPKMGQRNCDIFVAILKAENGTHECTRDNRGLNKNGSVDVGLAQINWNPKWNPPYTVEQLRDCKFNLDIALQKYKARGFQPWYAYTKGAYKKFLKFTPAAEIAAVEVQ